MKLIKYPAKETWGEILSRPTIDNKQLLKQVGKILQDVKQKGDNAVKKYTKKFDGIALRKMQVDAKEIKTAEAAISIELKQAIDQAYANILLFHSTQQELVKEVETMPGVHCWRKSIPLERVGLYIPGEQPLCFLPFSCWECLLLLQVVKMLFYVRRFQKRVVFILLFYMQHQK